MAEKIYPLTSELGIQRDGARSASKRWTDGQWMRFQRGIPKSMGGFQRVQPRIGYIKGYYPGNYTIGEYDSNTPDPEVPNLTWNPYLQYRPRGIYIKDKNNYKLCISGCVDDYRWIDTIVSTQNIPYQMILYYGTWKMPLSINYTNTGSKSSAVNICSLDANNNIVPMAYGNDPTTDFNFIVLRTANLMAVGPYIAFYPPNTQWVFETGYNNNIYKYDLSYQDLGTNACIYRQMDPTLNSDTLFGIPLYNLDNISDTYYSQAFTTKYYIEDLKQWKEQTEVVKVLPIVYATPLEGTTDKSGIKYISTGNIGEKVSTGLSIADTVPNGVMRQLSISGNPKGAGPGGKIGLLVTYGSDMVLPTANQPGHTGTGNYYFPAISYISGAPQNFSAHYIWSSDSVHCSGGVLNLAPYIFFYNFHPWNWSSNTPDFTNGYIAYTYPNMQIYTCDAEPKKADTPTQQSGDSGITPDSGTTIIQDFVQVANTKIVYGAPVRGGSYSPSGLFWSLDSLIKCYYVGDPTEFQFDTVASNISILSSKCVVEINGIFYWIGNDKFYVYNGTVQTLPNDTNLNFFFDNVDRKKAQKIWGINIERFNEIHWYWCNPNYDPGNYNGECNYILIFNYTKGEECWYDTPIPGTSTSVGVNAGRTCGAIGSNGSPIMLGSNPQIDFTPYSTATGSYYYMWKYEIGNDMTIPGLLSQNTPTDVKYTVQIALPSQSLSIPKFITSREISLSSVGPENNWNGVNNWLRLKRIEPDMPITGDIEFQLYGRKYSADYLEKLHNDLFLIKANTTCGVCLPQSVKVSATEPQNIIINGTYVGGTLGKAIFPYPRLINISNTGYLTIYREDIKKQDYYSLSANVTVKGTYRGDVQSEIIFIYTNGEYEKASQTKGTKLFDTVDSVTILFLDALGFDCTIPISIGTEIPKGTEEGNIEITRLLNFYTDINIQSRKFIIRLYQDILDGNIELGQFLMHFDVGDGRQ